MRLTPDQIREKLYRELPALNEDDICTWVLKLAADLQAPPTGEEVERLFIAIGPKIGDVAKYAQLNGPHGLSPEYAVPRWKEAVKQFDEAVRAYGAACFAAGRAEGGKAADVLKRLTGPKL